MVQFPFSLQPVLKHGSRSAPIKREKEWKKLNKKSRNESEMSERRGRKNSTEQLKPV